MIIEIPNENSIVKWKNDDKDDWKVAEISDLIKAYEVDVETQLLGAELHGMKIGYEEAQKKLLRPKGQWIQLSDNVYHFYCSVCETEDYYEDRTPKFCPDCGADMRGEKE